MLLRSARTRHSRLRRELAGLIASGVSNSEACRFVGVNRCTGTRWRYGRTVISSSGAELHYPPMATTRTTCLSGRFLSEDERVLIADRIRAGASLRAIGRYLGRPASTVFAVVPQTAAVPRYDPTC